MALPHICVPVSVNEGFVAVLVVRHAWTKASIVKSFADKFDKVPSSFKSCSFRFPLDLRVSSLPLPDTQQTDASSKNASCARSKHLCRYASGGVTPNVIECANTSYEGSLIGLPLQLCSETSLGRQRPLLFWPSLDHKGSSDVAITGIKVIASLTDRWARVDELRATRPLTSVMVTRGLAASEWRTRLLPALRQRLLHMIGSQVSFLALAIGRSSNSRLAFVTQRVAASCLAALWVPIFAIKATSENQADMPSQWW